MPVAPWGSNDPNGVSGTAVNLPVAHVGDIRAIYLQTVALATGYATDANAAPTFRIYENTDTTPIDTGTMVVFDDANTVGLYAFSNNLDATRYQAGNSYLVRARWSMDGANFTAAIVDAFSVRVNPALAFDTSGRTSLFADGLRTVDFTEPVAYPADYQEALLFVAEYLANHTTRNRDSGLITIYDRNNNPLLRMATTADDPTAITEGKNKVAAY